MAASTWRCPLEDVIRKEIMISSHEGDIPAVLFRPTSRGTRLVITSRQFSAGRRQA